MPIKNILQDIKPISRESKRPALLSEVSRPLPKLPREVPFEPEDPGNSSRYGLWYVAAACVVAFLFSLSFLFEHATVSITPKSIPVALDSTDTFTAEKDSTVDGTIVYTAMTLSGDESMKLPSTQSKVQSLPATGTAVIYNSYAPTAYALVKGTRLATPDGKIYRIDTGVSIPGYSKVGQNITPGSVEVTITAATPGEASNIDHSDFSIPGLAKTAQATKIFGRTKTPISGGLSGTVYSIGQDAANAAQSTLKDKLKASLEAKAKVQIPDGYIFYDGATSFTADDAVQVPYSKVSDVPLALHGTLVAYLIKEDTLINAIATKSISQYNNEAVTIPQIASLTLTPT